MRRDIRIIKNIQLVVIILLLFVAGISAGLGVILPGDRSYSIPLMDMDLYPQEDGSLHVKETIHYSFKGTYKGVYRDIPLKGTQKIENVNVSTQGAYSRFTETNSSGKRQVKVYLYSDPKRTTPISDKDVDVTIEYDFAPMVKFYNDVAELQYKLVGEYWEVDIGQVNAKIHLKSKDGVKYWLNPPYYNESSAWQGNTLQLTSTKIPSSDFYELRMIIPKGQFDADPKNGIIINQNALEEIESIQNKYQDDINFKTNLYSFLTVLLLLACFIPILIYYRFGREPKIDYQADYERDLPTDDPPAIVNAICGPGFSKRIGEPDMDGFKATIMDLLNRKYLLFEKGGPEDTSPSDEMTFKFNPQEDTSKLKNYEKEIIHFLRGYEENGVISLDYISEELKNRENAKSFRDTYLTWRDDIKEQHLHDDVLQKIFIKKGDNYLKIFGGAALVLSAVVFYFTLNNPIPAAWVAWISSVVLGVVGIVSLIMPQKIAGQWTTYGEEYDAKWQNFKKYIKDFSLIKEYPPESVAIWNKYLVYATALGVADAVRKAMELSLPHEELEDSEIYMFHHYGGYVLLADSLDTGMTTASAADGSDGGDFGGVGDVGGGFGGGGGGAF